ncbi:RING-H2 finger protein ATL13 [Brachypodium distachyon]|uniref:RING-type E3 ubiquitin transferase n=1 Tax=Brachypodium distachyon TaxID=15368 RepID=A0A0Q3H978_BRADI|nr:RING-H2 finger protein ATL13 [Brachypodium distachyon]KQK19213.1 hypothetical protein BRADI_1g46992v3 [Brachypodium distachyon]|eukprot:XP_003560973.1 RING-H2 finger protein ATL13 [Brachypodium distachyon]
MDASASSSSAAAPPAHPSVLDTIQTKLSPGVLLVVAILAMVFFIFGLLNLLVQNILRLRRARRRRLRVGDADGSPTALQGQLQQLFHLHDAGVDQAFIDALPVFLYRDIVKGAGKEEDGGGAFDCAVCLCEFAMDDGLRLLPTCGHAFHVPCIDAWLLSHSTCPLCRRSVLADLDLAPEPSSPALLVLESEVTAMEALGVDNEGAPKAEEDEEVVEVKLGKLRCVDGIGNGVAVETTGRSSDDNGNNGRRSLGQRRCLSMGSYEYVMDGRAALRVAIKTPNKKLQSASRSRRRRHALSDFDFGFGNAKKLGAPAWEAAVRDQAADAVAAGSMRCGGEGAAAAGSRLKKDSFSVSKIWMVPAAAAARKEEGRALVGGGSRRSVSFRWPAMAAAEASRSNEGGDVEAQPGGGSSGNIAGERTAPLWAAGGWQTSSSSAGSHP